MLSPNRGHFGQRPLRASLDATLAMSPRVTRVVGCVAAVTFLAAGAYSFLWIFSSASLACVACDCTYSLFAPTFRCRQPVIAEVLSVVFLLLFIGSCIIVAKSSRSPEAPRPRG